VRSRRSAWCVLGILIATVSACGNNGDPDPQAVSTVEVCSDVQVHAWATMNIGTATHPELKNVDYDVDATGHDRDPHDQKDIRRSCGMVAGAFGSEVRLTAASLNDGKPYSVTTPLDRQHLRVVRLTKAATGTVTATQELVEAH
jgi:hypothetical protein